MNTPVRLILELFAIAGVSMGYIYLSIFLIRKKIAPNPDIPNSVVSHTLVQIAAVVTWGLLFSSVLPSLHAMLNVVTGESSLQAILAYIGPVLLACIVAHVFTNLVAAFGAKMLSANTLGLPESIANGDMRIPLLWIGISISLALVLSPELRQIADFLIPASELPVFH